MIKHYKEGYKSKKEFQSICKNCKHNHVAVTGDNGENLDEERYEVLDSCCYCSCEYYG